MRLGRKNTARESGARSNTKLNLMDFDNTQKLEDENYQIIFDLKPGMFFGEVAMLSKLGITNSVHTSEPTICCTIEKKKFLEFLDQYQDCKRKLTNQIFQYHGVFFQNMHRLLSNVPFFQNFQFESLRSLCIKMQKIRVAEGKVLCHFREILNKMIFVLEGELELFVYNPDKHEKYFFQSLRPGGSFNVVASLLGQESIMICEASEECEIMIIEREDYIEAAKTNQELFNQMQAFKREYSIAGYKYDYYTYSGRKVENLVTESNNDYQN